MAHVTHATPKDGFNIEYSETLLAHYEVVFRTGDAPTPIIVKRSIPA